MFTTNRRFRFNKLLRLPGWLIGLALVFCFSILSSCNNSQPTANHPETIRLDYAYYNPVSLVLKEKGWLEEDLAKDQVKVEWVLSQGSNKALEFLNGRSIDFGSTAGAAALIGKANGNPIKSVYVYSKPEWTALEDVWKVAKCISTQKSFLGFRLNHLQNPNSPLGSHDSSLRERTNT